MQILNPIGHFGRGQIGGELGPDSGWERGRARLSPILTETCPVCEGRAIPHWRPHHAALHHPTDCGPACGPAAADEAVTDFDRFELWNECEPVSLVVGLDGDAEVTGLTEETIKTAARSRLRGARLYDGDAYHRLYIAVIISGAAFSMELLIIKSLYDPTIDKMGAATTWSDGAIGTHGGSGDYILNAIGRYTDTFIDEYLRVNAEAC